MYESGKIIYVGGGGYTGWDTPDPKSPTPTETAEKIDLNVGSPAWTSRRLHELPAAPPERDGAAGRSGAGDRWRERWRIQRRRAPASAGRGDLGSGHQRLDGAGEQRGDPRLSLRVDPHARRHRAAWRAAETPTSRRPARRTRAQRNHEIFSPPYLFKGARPSIADAPASVGYGQSFDVTTPAAGQITHVRLDPAGLGHPRVRCEHDGGVAGVHRGRRQHHRDGAPANPNVAPPGHYMIFVLNRNGVPSIGRIIRVQ